jgi:hypothetical protein
MPKTKAILGEEKDEKSEKVLDPDLLLDDDAAPIVDPLEETTDEDDEEDELALADDEVDPFKDRWEE